MSNEEEARELAAAKKGVTEAIVGAAGVTLLAGVAIKSGLDSVDLPSFNNTVDQEANVRIAENPNSATMLPEDVEIQRAIEEAKIERKRSAKIAEVQKTQLSRAAKRGGITALLAGGAAAVVIRRRRQGRSSEEQEPSPEASR